MTEIHGLTGKLLRIDLGSGTWKPEAIPGDVFVKFIGGRGMGACYLCTEVPPYADPLGPENKLVFMNGPLIGSLIPGANKTCLSFKSPLTNSYSYSLCGGHWGAALKFAGYDGLIIEGESSSPVYILIDNGKVEIRPAGHVWGKTIPESDELIRNGISGGDRSHIALIGPAGELRNLMACVTADRFREFGRGGCGAVMGAKKLKGIAVRPSGDIGSHDVNAVRRFSERIYAALAEHPVIKDRKRYGTPELVKIANTNGYWSVRNFTGGFMEEGEKLEGRRMRKEVVVGDASCYGCPVACGKRSRIVSETFGTILTEGPEFETISLLGANCGVSDWKSIIEAAHICDAWGFDTMNAGSCVALAMECFERGIITLDDTGGIDLRFGNGEALVKTLQLMARREGIGDVLAGGVAYAAEKFGAPELAMHVKGQGLAAYDPRGVKGMGLTYAVSPKGAHHMTANTAAVEFASGKRLDTGGKAAMQRTQQISMCVVDSLGLCSTMRAGMPLPDQAEALRIVTGIDMDVEKLERAALRVLAMERLYNARMGVSGKDDILPNRFLIETLDAGGSAGETVRLDEMRAEFYALMGWDRNGIPERKMLDDSGLGQFV